MDTVETIAGSTEDEFELAFKQELAAQFDGELINLVVAICDCVDNIEHNFPKATSLTMRLAVFVENIELRIRKELE